MRISTFACITQRQRRLAPPYVFTSRSQNWVVLHATRTRPSPCYPVDPISRHISTTLNPPSIQLHQAIASVISRNNYRDLETLEGVLQKLQATSHQSYSIEFQGAFQVFVDKGRRSQGLKFLELMHRYPTLCSPTRDNWHTLIPLVAKNQDEAALQDLLDRMKDCGCSPTGDTYRKVFESVFAVRLPDTAFMIHSIRHMRVLTMPYDRAVSRTIMTSYARMNRYGLGRWMQRLYKTTLQSSDDPGEIEFLERLAAAKKEGVHGAFKAYSDTKASDFKPSTWTLAALLNNASTLEDLDFLERRLGVQADVISWSILVDRALEKHGLSYGLLVYEKARALVRPDAIMIHPLLRALCSTKLRGPSNQALDRALSIFRDIAEPSEPSLPPSDYIDRELYNPDTPVFNTLLRGTLTSNSPHKYLPIAMDLLEDMRKRDLPFDYMTNTSVAVASMKMSSSYTEALEGYRRVRQVTGAQGFDAIGFKVILTTFSRLSFGEGSFPPPALYFEIVRDMGLNGFHITVDVYRNMIHQLTSVWSTAQIGDPIRAEAIRRSLLDAVRRTHDLINVDARVEPTVALWTQTMDAYQRLGAFDEGLKIWDMLVRTRKYDNAAVSVILDGCGYAGKYNEALAIQRVLGARKFAFNLRNWLTWVECLCRLGKLQDAVNVVCFEMTEAHVQPDVEFAILLLKFAHPLKQRKNVLFSLRDHLPNLWGTLPDKWKASE